MKRALIGLATALVLGGVFGVLMARDPGYVLVSYQRMALETSLWFALLVLVLAYVAFRLLVGLWHRVGSGRGSLVSWNQRRRDRAARDQTVRGLLLMAEGRWAEARKLLEGSARRVEAPLINYLNAARAAHETGDERGRDELLRAAHESTPGSRFAVGLNQAEFQRDQGQWELCLATLLQLHRQAPRHAQVMRMLVDCYRHLEDWQAILELLGALQKNKVLDDAGLKVLQREAWLGRLRSERDSPKKLWASVPRDLRSDAELVAAFALAMADAGEGAQAESVLRSAIDHTWSPPLVRLYGTLITEDPGPQLVVAEGWLKERPNDPDLLLALGRISLMNRQWAKAREYLEASLRLRRSAEAQSELGRLCAALGETERGSELLAQSLDGLPALPMPERATGVTGH